MSGLVRVAFRGDTLFALERDGEVFVALRPIVEALGLDWSAQRQRIVRDPILSEGVVVITAPSAGGEQETLCLPLGLFSGWLFGVSDRRISDPATRAKVLTYKREAYAALHRHFFGGPTRAGLPFSTKEALALASEARRVAGPRVALAVWRRLGLPGAEALAEEVGASRRERPALAAPERVLVARFVGEALEARPGARLANDDAWRTFGAFCRARGMAPVARGAFFIEIGRLGVARAKSAAGRFLLDVAPRGEGEA